MNCLIKIFTVIRRMFGIIWTCVSSDVFFGKHMAGVPEGSMVFFPCRDNLLCCGLTGIVSFKQRKKTRRTIDIQSLKDMLIKIQALCYENCRKNNLNLEDHYLGGQTQIHAFLQNVRDLKCNDLFYTLYIHRDHQEELATFADSLLQFINEEERLLDKDMGNLEADDVDIVSRRIDGVKDAVWCLSSEISSNIIKIKDLLRDGHKTPTGYEVNIFKQINAVLNSIDRLEVRGRDSAGISMMFVLEGSEFDRFQEKIKKGNLYDQLTERSTREVLVNQGIKINASENETGQKRVALALTYKVAAEVGRLGDNVQLLRKHIKNDGILHKLVSLSPKYYTISAHTRWASVGAISEPNCHPVDNSTIGNHVSKSGIIHACLNGDIDNYMELKKEYERCGCLIPQDITTDTKIIPLQIEKYIHQGVDIQEAFRLAVNDFKGSHAISMHTDLAPGKIFLAQKGSGQAIFIGIAKDYYVPTSEVYGLVEETPFFIKMDGEKEVDGRDGRTRGQIFILNQDTAGGVDGITATYYDNTPIDLGENDIKHTEITSRDIDRQDFPHYFLKEISESPRSVEKTLRNRWKLKEGKTRRYVITLDEKTFPKTLQQALLDKKIRRIFFVGQGTAGVAAHACADILGYYLDDPSLYLNALKASELSGFKLNDGDDKNMMADALVIAISQSGTTTDTNRTIDMVKERGAYTMAIVNRRDSDITFKVDGVMYTSSGRDVEMSVASTKAFYSQIVAGALLGLKIAALLNRRSDDFVAEQLKALLELPGHMRTVLSMHKNIGNSAKRLATTKTYWAAVGSGPNKASADEIRIKLSELCYKTISSDYVEDKKHIDLSSEPLIIVCAAGVRGTVIKDIIKDTAIFQAHKATVVVIANQGENRFDLYAADVFHVPIVSEHFAPILNTLVGHIWGYYAAMAINEGSRFLYGFHNEIQKTVDDHANQGMDVYELILEKAFREKIAFFYKEFRRKKADNSFPSAMGLEAASDLTLLLKYLSGRLPVSDFEIDFGKKGTALNMLNTLFECMGQAINCMSRPVDAIRHQAKTVTVGTSRISDKVEGILFETLAAYNIQVSQLINRNIMVLKNLQKIVSVIKGAIFYKIGGLNVLGEPTEQTTIEIIKKDGTLQPIPSRVETDSMLKGTKRIIVREGNVYIGKGRKDDRSIIVIPVISNSPATPNLIEHILLLNISFKENVPLDVKIKALGGKYERIKNIVQENSVIWDERYIELVEMKELFGISAEKIGEFIVSRVS
ncbi:MAG: SIS domain-containing protein [Desulfobacterales bacterium]